MVAAGALLQIVGNAIIAPAPPFPVMCLAVAINGLSGAFIDAQGNALVASIKDGASTKMGLLHAAYGAPLSCLFQSSTPLIAFFRSRSSGRSFGINAICSARTLVFPLSRISRSRYRFRHLIDPGLPRKGRRWYVYQTVIGTVLTLFQ